MLSFRLTETFLDSYRAKEVDWGFRDAGDNSLGELTFIRTYSRIKEDGTKERWWEVCERVINGMYSIQKDYAKKNSLPWNDRKAHASAQEAFDRLFSLKWTPPGRGLWMMGTDFVMSRNNSAPLQNCAFVSTGDIDKMDPGQIFAFSMETLMLGIGLGWDTDAVDKNIHIYQPVGAEAVFMIPDSREGWVESLRILINSYLKPNQTPVGFDYSSIRSAGKPIRGFGGTASGPEPLRQLHDKLSTILSKRAGDVLGTEVLADIMNLIGACVVSGNVRRSAELALGKADDVDFINLKNPEYFPERNSYDTENPGWGWMSNNSLSVEVGQDYDSFADRIVSNGEPGFVWLDTTRKFGRLKDAPDSKDYRVKGYNPCAEQPLESFEMCTLVEVHINRAESREDFLRTLKFAYLYGKTVTLVPTHWERTNAVMQRNRRIGASITGISGFVDAHGLSRFRDWADTGYEKTKFYDTKYSEWLGVRESIRRTTVKPSGSVSLLSGATPGVHWSPGGRYFMRAIRFASDDRAVELFIRAGYVVEDDLVSANTKVVYFPVFNDVKFGEREVSIFEKINLAVEAQRYWSDNSVSVTVSFDKETEAKYIPTVLKMYEGQLKSVSFLPMGNKTYPQQPYTEISKEEYDGYIGKLSKINTSALYGQGAEEAKGEVYCTTDACEIKLS